MRNLAILQDHLHALEWINSKTKSDSRVVSLTCNHAANKIYTLQSDGKIVCFEYLDSLVPKYTLQLKFEDVFEHWFQIDYVPTISTIVCISSEGSIATFEEVDEQTPTEPDQIGVIDGGVAAAKWHPDYSCILLITNNHTLLSMSNSWDVLTELDIPQRNLNSPIDISWKGDGEMFCIVSQDSVDGIGRVRIYDSSHYELLQVAKNVAQEGNAAVMKGVGQVVSFATNGSYIALHQVKVGANIDQIALVEKNGLRHGDFDLRTPPVREGFQGWNVVGLQWDLTSTLLAVSWRCVSKENPSSMLGCVQWYYRENYFWYCKQQLMEEGLIWLGFDQEKSHRCYCSQSSYTSTTGETLPILRIVDLHWEMASSVATRDGSVTVVDGQKLYLTPLGYHSIPPPMSMHTLTLPSKAMVGRYVSYWANLSTAAHQDHVWGMAVLVNDLGDVVLYHGNERGQPLSTAPKYSLCVGELLTKLLHGQGESTSNTTNDIKYRRVLVTENDKELWVYVIGSMISYHAINEDGSLPSTPTGNDISDVVICLQVVKATIPTVSEGANSTIVLPVKSISIMDHVPGNITYLTTLCPTTHSLPPVGDAHALTHRIVIGFNNHHTNDYEIHLLAPYDWLEVNRQREGEGEEEVYMLSYDDDYQSVLITTIPEDCVGFTVVTHTTTAESHEPNSETVMVKEEEKVIASTEGGEGTEEEITSVLATAATTTVGEVTTVASSVVDQTSTLAGDAPSTAVASRQVVLYTVLAMTTRQRLYANDRLLFHGISSYVYNPVAMLLMFITLGTKPHLHYIPFTSLPTAQLAAEDRHEHLPNALEEELVIYECSEPRPVERGAKLVASIAGDSKVIIQLPRGNLEIFEPRPMVLMQIQQTILHCQFLDALLLMRRQRIHTNYLLDFYPTLFFTELSLFVKQIMQHELMHVLTHGGSGHQSRVSSSGNSNDLLSLFIASWINEDVTLTKYPMILPTSTLAASMANTKATASVKVLHHNQPHPDSSKEWLISSIEDYIHQKVTFLQAQQILPSLPATTTASSENKVVTKVNFFCDALRTILFRELTHACESLAQEVEQEEKEGVVSTKKRELQATISYLFYPILCTFAKQSPPMIEEGLLFIKQYCLPAGPSAATGTVASLTTMNLTAAIKYFHFLISSEELFTTALSMGEFVLCRAIGRQCQMDPKHYLPLIASFESLGQGYAPDHYQSVYMMYAIAKHVKSLPLLYKHYVKMIATIIEMETTLPAESPEITALQTFMTTIWEKEIIAAGLSMIQNSTQELSLFQYLTQLESQYASYFPTATASATSSLQSITILIRSLFNPFRLHYASKLMSSSTKLGSANPLDSVLQCYLTCYPPNYPLAIECAVSAQAYPMAMTLVQQAHYLNYKYASSAGVALTGATLPTPKQVVQQIVQQYQQQASMYGGGSNGDGTVEYAIPEVAHLLQDYLSLHHPLPTDILANTGTAATTSSSSGTGAEDKALFVANLLLQYSQDVETASSILITAQHYAYAIQITRQYERYDLLEEIYATIRQHCEDTIDYLTSQGRQYSKLVDELNAFWQVPEDRMNQIATVDTALAGFLKRTGGEEYAEAGDDGKEGEGDDTQSNFSAATRYSTLSIRSAMSAYSLLSSKTSQSSASSVSILSQLSSTTAGSSLLANGGASGAGGEGDEESSSFRIEGLDHSLLSRGTVSKKQQFQDRQKAYQQNQQQSTEGAGGEGEEVVCSNPNNPRAKPGKVYARDLKPRQQKRIERAKTKGYSKDIYNVKREHQLCEQLFAFAHVSFYLQLIQSYTQILSMTNTLSDHELLTRLYSTFQSYLTTLQSKPLLPAPAYPKEWLVQRQYTIVYYYQDHHQLLEQALHKKVQYLLEHQAISSTTWDEKKWLLAKKDMVILGANIKNWWQIANEGIQAWQEKKLLHYSAPAATSS